MNVLKKYELLLLIMLFTFFSANAQHSHKGILSISAGPAIPMGKFSKNDTFDHRSAFASTGQFASIAFTKPFNEQTVLIFTLQIQRNPLDRGNLSRALSAMKIYNVIWVGPGPIPPPSYNKYDNWSVEKASLVNASLLAGTSHKLRTNNRAYIFSLDASVGVCYLSVPQINALSTTDTSMAKFFRSEESGIGFIFSAGCTVKYQMGNSFLFTSVSYLRSSKIRLKDVRTVITNTGGSPGSPNYYAQQSVQTRDIQQAIISLNISLGIGFRL